MKYSSLIISTDFKSVCLSVTVCSTSIETNFQNLEISAAFRVSIADIGDGVRQTKEAGVRVLYSSESFLKNKLLRNEYLAWHRLP